MYDFCGDEFESPVSAIEFAQSTAQLLAHSLYGDWRGWSIEVRDPMGKKLFSLPV